MSKHQLSFRACFGLHWTSPIPIFSFTSERSIKISCDQQENPQVSANTTKRQKQQVRKRELMVLLKTGNQLSGNELFPPLLPLHIIKVSLKLKFCSKYLLVPDSP